MQRCTQNPPKFPCWQYTGSNWSTIKSEATAQGWPIDGTDNGNGTVTIKMSVLGKPTTVTMHSTDWLMPQGADKWNVITAAAFSAGFTITTTQAELDGVLF